MSEAALAVDELPEASAAEAPRAIDGVFGVPLPDLLVLAYAVGVIVVWGPQLLMGMVTPKVAILLVGLGPGAVVLGGLVRGGDRAARWLVGYLAWALFAALASGAIRISVLGGFGLDRGWLVLVGYGAAWALGRRLGPVGRRLLPAALLGALALSAVVGTFQAAADPGGAMAMIDGRANGLAPSSIYFGGQMGGALVLLAAVMGRADRRWLLGLPGVVLFALAANLSGSRSALAVAALVALLAVWAPGVGDRPLARRLLRIACVAGAIALGVLGSTAFDLQGASSARLEGAGGGGGVGTRVTMWDAGVRAAAERPLTGWGPGRFRTATSSRVTASFARAEGPDRLFFDAHNLAVEHLTTTGIIGLVALAGFAVAAARKARGPLAWFAAAMAALWLLSPVSVATGPAALVALGAAAPAWSAPSGGHRRLARAVGGALALLGLLAGASLVLADRHAELASQSGSVDEAVAAQRFLPPDDVLADLEAQARGRIAGFGSDPDFRREAVAAARRPVALDPTRPTWWVHLGYAEGRFGPGSERERLRRAEADFRIALEHNPWSVDALEGMRRVAVERDDAAAEARWSERLCRVTECED